MESRFRNPVASICMESGEIVKVELLPHIAPQSVYSFIHLADAGVFDNYSIRRVDPGQCIEPSYTEFENDLARYYIPNDTARGDFLPVTFGTVAMGGHGPDRIAGGDFFFPLTDADVLNGVYPVFGRVIEGQEELQRIGQVKVIIGDIFEDYGVKIYRPEKPEIIKSVTVETFDIEYPAPEKLETF